MAISSDPDSISRLIHAIHQLPSDKPVEGRQSGYNNYDSQKNHWLGWLGENPPALVRTHARPERTATRSMSTITLLSRKCSSDS